MPNRYDELAGNHEFDDSLSGSSSNTSLSGPKFQHAAGHSFSRQQIRVSSSPTVTRQGGGCCLFNLGCIITALFILVPIGLGILTSALEDPDIADAGGELISMVVCPNRTTLVLDGTLRADLTESIETVTARCETASGRIAQDLTDEARNALSIGLIVVGGYLLLLVLNVLLRILGTAVGGVAGSRSLAGSGQAGLFSDLASGLPSSLGSSSSRSRSTGLEAGSLALPRRDSPALTSQLERRDRAAQQLDQLKEAYGRGGMSIEDYDRRRKQILEQL